MGVMMMNRNWGILKLRDVWFMYNNLSIAVEELNTVYSLQLLLWIFTFSLNALSRLYTIINYKDYRMEFVAVLLRDGFCAISFFLIIFIITLSCHSISRRVSGKIIDKTLNINRYI